MIGLCSASSLAVGDTAEGDRSQWKPSRLVCMLRVKMAANNAVPGTTHRLNTGMLNRISSSASAGPNRRALIFGEGGRRLQDCNFVSNVSEGFHSFIFFAFQTQFYFLQTVAIASCHGVRRNFQQPPDLVEGVAMPDLENDHLALFGGEAGEAAHRLFFLRGFLRCDFEPSQRFQLAGDPSPQTAFVVKSAVSEAAKAIMPRFFRSFSTRHQGHKGLLQHIFRFAMA